MTDLSILEAFALSPPFVPFTPWRNRHAMTIFPSLLPRRLSGKTATAIPRTFTVAPNAQILAHCHIHDASKPAVIIVHGLEGSSQAPNVVGLANKTLQAGFNVVRMNLRNCGNTFHLTKTLYNAGMSGDVMAVARELNLKDGITSIFLAGFSLGGNIVLKAAAELKEEGAKLVKGVCGISPSIDLAAAVESMQSGFNQVYEQRFLLGLKAKIAHRHKVLADRQGPCADRRLSQVRRLKAFDDIYTSVDAGYDCAAAYYQGASALNILHQAQLPILIIAAQDDPIVPFNSFNTDCLKSPFITLLTPTHGGHGGFFSLHPEVEIEEFTADRFWAENRCVNFFLHLSA